MFTIANMHVHNRPYQLCVLCGSALNNPHPNNAGTDPNSVHNRPCQLCVLCGSAPLR